MRFLLVTFALFPLIANANCKDEGAHAEHKQHKHGEGPTAAAMKDFGQGIRLADAPVALSKAAKALSPEKELVIQGKVGTVCQQSGCWITLRDGKTEARVTYNHAFFLPKSAGKKTALVQGKIFEKEISMEEARHYAKDAGASKKEIEKIQGPQKSLWIEATGIRLL